MPRPLQTQAESGPRWPVYAAALLWFGAVLVLSLRFSGGDPPYSLDDAWIHLHFAENLAHGHWGMEPGQLSVPSSSILWPWLLAPFAGTAFLPWWPLLLNLLCTLAALKLILDYLRPLAPLPVTGLLVLAFANLVGLALTGMEHSLQILLALLILHGLRARLQGRRALWWIEVLWLAPLVRYEMLALVLPAILLVAWKQERRWLLLLPAVFVFPLAYSFWLHHLGLPGLPTSVLAKSGPAASGSLLALPLQLAGNLAHNLQLPQGRVLGAVTILCGLLALRRKVPGHQRELALWITAALALHLLGGRTGWLNRYEIQVWLPALLVLLGAAGPWLRRAGSGWTPEIRQIALCGLLFFAALPYLRTSLETPWGVRNIHEQQAQMARFSREYWPHPVAVNDLGRVSFRNPQAVLDLWGLSSPRALQGRLAGAGSSWADTLCREQGITLAMLYEDWFDTLPAGWQELGRLRLGSRRVSSDRSEVVFYLLDPALEESVRKALSDWMPGLPAGAGFHFSDK